MHRFPHRLPTMIVCVTGGLQDVPAVVGCTGKARVILGVASVSVSGHERPLICHWAIWLYVAATYPTIIKCEQRRSSMALTSLQQLHIIFVIHYLFN